MAANLLFGALNSGEFSPLLDGRVDKDFYGSGAKALENFIPLVQGPVLQRSGTGFVKEVKSSANRTALIPFQFNTDQAYALEFGDQYMRVLKDHAIVTFTPLNITGGITNANPGVVTSLAHGLSNGDRVIPLAVGGMIEVNNREFVVAGVTANTFQLQGVDTTGYGVYTAGGTISKIYEIATPYLQADLFETDGRLRIKFAQTADVMYLVHPSYAPRKLTRTGHTAWTLTAAAFTKGPFSAPNGNEAVRVLCTATAGTYQPGDAVTLQANSAIFDANMVGMLFFMEELYEDPSPISKWAAAQPASNVVGTKVLYDGNMYSIQGSNGTNFGAVAPTHTAGQAYDNSVVGTASYRRLRYLHSRWAIIQLSAFTDSKNMSGTIVTYLCEGLAPASQAITNATNAAGLIRITSAAHDYVEQDYVTITGVGGVTAANGDWRIINVAANTFDLEGSVFAGVYTAGGTVKRFATWKWQMGAFSASKGYPSVVALHDERLMLGATADEPDTYWLSESGSYDSFAERSANQILATNSLRGILANGQVNKIEWSISMEDGLVMGTASGEYLLQPASNTEALGPGNFKAPPVSGHGSRSVQPVRVGRSAFFIQRAGKKVRDLGYGAGPQDQIGTDMTVRAEHLMQASPVIGMAWVQEPDALLWAARADGKLLAFTFQQEQTVYAWGRHKLGGFSDVGQAAAPIVESVISIPAPDGLTTELWLIVKRYVDGATKRFVEYMRPRWVPSSEDYTPLLRDAVISDSGLTYNGALTATVTGLWHLRGQTVAPLVDGRIHPNVVVDNSGKITLQYQGAVIQIGLPFRARIKPMRLESAVQSGTGQGKRKVINKVALRCIDATTFRYGRNFDQMRYKEFTTSSQPLDSPVPMFNGDKIVDWPGEWGLEALLCIENDKPVPFGIAALFPEVQVAS